MENTPNLELPESFDFPFTPYDIQSRFMKTLYSVIDNKQLGIFESPTGTGKSLSIICGAIRWLKDYTNQERTNIQNRIEKIAEDKQKLSENSTDWLSSQSKEIELTHKMNELKLVQNKITEYDTKIEKMKERKKSITDKKKWKRKNNKKETKDDLEAPVDKIDEIGDEDMLLEEGDGNLEDQEDKDSDEETDNKYEPPKIYISSRTHSQLAQFVGEILKSPFAEDIRVVSLASRQTYCINPAVVRLKSMALINEKCLDMQNKTSKPCKVDSDGKTVKKQKVSGKCPHFRQQGIDELREIALLEVQDIEDLVTSGKELNACPYYASRKAAEDAEVVLIPYNTLLHKPTREANGIKLKNSIVIIDEAHNLLEALAQMHSSEVNYVQLEHALMQLKNYKQRYNTRFSAPNLLSINQLIFVTTKLFKVLEDGKEELKDTKTDIFTIENFVLSAQIDNYNMFKLIKFCKESRIAQKLHGFATRYPTYQLNTKTEKTGLKKFLTSIENQKSKKIEEPELKEDDATKKPPPSNPLLAVISFLQSLTYSYQDGRILVHKTVDKTAGKLQFLLLNPASNFKDIVAEARSVIVAGGTMKPNAEFRDRLFISAGAQPERIVEFSCDHIIPPENILPIIMTRGPSGDNLLFNFENRMSMGSNIKAIIEKACKNIKGGIVVFFPSYKYENWVWQQLKNVQFGRPVFREPQDSGSVEAVLTKYADVIKKTPTRSALLFSVVGGKLSEGLNFSDDLGRCVIVVGLPYANIKAVDLKEKMAYLDKHEGFGAGQKFYEGLCMKAVNQCIGRAVRHRNDYATVLLLDQRYDRQATKNALPGWIKRSLRVANFQESFRIINEFFNKMANKQ